MARIRVRRVAGARVVALRVWLPGGSTAEIDPGQAWVSGRLLIEGSRQRDWRRIAETAEARGVGMAADAGYEAQGLALDALADDWELALEWGAELVVESTFPEERCRWVVRQTAAELELLADHPDVRTGWAFARQLYGTGARGRPLQGTAESLERLDSATSRRFHRACLDRGAIVSLAGDVDEAAALRKAESLFGHLPDPVWSDGASPQPSSPELESRSDSEQRVILDQAEQAHWLGGAVTVSRRDPDYWTLALLGVILGAGGGLTGRISHRVREIEGLAYGCGVATVDGAGRQPGCLSVAIGGSPERVNDIGAVVTAELAGVVGDGVGADELAEARSYVLGREPFARETAGQWANLMAQAELFGLPLEDPSWVVDRWSAVTRTDIHRVARRYLDPDRLRVTIGIAE